MPFLRYFPNNAILANIIRYICTSDFIKNKSTKIDEKNIVINIDNTYKAEELYVDTYKKLFNNKTKQQ